jgi:hypothetical protein
VKGANCFDNVVGKKLYNEVTQVCSSELKRLYISDMPKFVVAVPLLEAAYLRETGYFVR